MLKSCSNCGRIHNRGERCPNKKERVRLKNPTEMSKFRGSVAWRKTSLEVRARDKFICQVCMTKKYNTTLQYNFNNLEVHHIVPIHENWSMRLDMSNCITLCRYHHELAEDGTIPRKELMELVKKGENYGNTS